MNEPTQSQRPRLTMTTDELDRLRAVEVAVSDIRVRQAEFEALLHRNIEATSEVKRDTSEIVRLVKGATVFGQVARWFALVIGAFLAGKGLKWW